MRRRRPIRGEVRTVLVSSALTTLALALVFAWAILSTR